MAANPAWPGVCKIGFARDLKNRLRSLNTGDPFRAFTFYETKEFANRAKAEATLHRLVAGFKLARVGEWYSLHPEDAAALLRGLHRRSALEAGSGGDAGEPD
ncbi:GIY-YIG nuclease family protein [Sinorhizobium medicae]|uniref:GIY-YIG nuclease family protein n=1 Tax=Sinorhizobium medicae TaxID=110321 RepID=UPI0013E37072